MFTYAKFIERDKNIIFHVLNKSNTLKRAKSNGGMTAPTAVSVVNALNRVLDWVKLNPPMNEDENDTDYNYLVSKLFYLVMSLDQDTIKRRVVELIEFGIDRNGNKYNSFSAKKKYLTEVLDRFAKDERVISIIDRYTFANKVDNIQETTNREARLSSFDLYTFSLLFTFSRVYYISYLTVMDAGDYVSMISDSLFGTEDTRGLADMLFSHTIITHYKDYIGLIDRNFIDRFIYQYMAPYIDNKMVTDKGAVDKFGIAGINQFSLYQKCIQEMFSGLHRITASLEKGNEGDDKDDYDTSDPNADPSDRKFYFKKIAKYLFQTLTRILTNTLRNFKPGYSMRVEGGDLDAEKDVFDSHVNENKENYEYVNKIKDDLFKDALAGIRNDTLKISENTAITKHNLGKFIISIYMNLRYGIAEPVNVLSLSEYKAIIFYLFDRLEDYPNLRMGLIGKVYSGINNASVDLKDFEKAGAKGIPAFIAPNVNKSLNILTNLVKTRYYTEIQINKTKSLSKTYDIKDDLIRFLMNVHEVFNYE